MARSTFYDIQKKTIDLLEKHKEEKTFNYEFYTKKFTNNFKMKRIIFLAKKTKLDIVNYF